MREKWARRVVLFTGMLVMLLAVVFARIQNPAEQPINTDVRQQSSVKQQSELTRFDAEKIEAGKGVYRQQNCARCHSIAGKGNPRNPLDHIGEIYNADELRDWITGGDSLQDELPDYIFNLKQRYRQLSDDELESLVTYMQSLR